MKKIYASYRETIIRDSFDPGIRVQVRFGALGGGGGGSASCLDLEP
jgi:hypothetical protein